MKISLSEPMAMQSVAYFLHVADSTISSLENLSEGRSATDAIHDFLEEHHISVFYSDFLDGANQPIDAVYVHIEGEEDWILINKRILEFENEAMRKSYENYLFLHEFCHAFKGHFRMPVHSAGSTCIDSMANALMSYSKYLQCEREQEIAAETFAMRMAFHPVANFVKLFKKTEADMLQIANSFRMPLDCAVKFALVQFSNNTKMHYCKWICNDEAAVDWYSSPGHLPDEFVRKLPLQEGTVARRVLENKEPSSNTHKSIAQSSNVLCKAFYRKKEHRLLADSDAVIVFGMSLEGLNIFDT